MKKTSTNFVWVGYFVAGLFELINILHNYVAFPDTDKFIAYSLLSCCVFGIAWLYDKYKKLNWKLDALEENLQERLE